MSFINKYTPIRFSDVVISDPSAKAKLDRWVQSKSLDPLLLYGPPGTGKSTIAKFLPKAIDPNFEDFELKWMIADCRSNIATRISELSEFCKYISLNPTGKRFVVIDEIDNLTSAIQASLKGHIDKFSGSVNFVFTTNHINKIDEAIRSRCNTIHIIHRDMQAWLPRMKSIMESENCKGCASDEQLLDIANYSRGDCRNLLRSLEDLIWQLKTAA